MRSWVLKHPFWSGLGVLLLVFLVWPVPGDELKYSRSVYSAEGTLLSAQVSGDGQWCLPLEEDLPEAFKTCIIEYEDAWFYWHPGINPVSMAKAFYAYLSKGRVVRGASTLPMQVMRMRFKNANRSILNKLSESISAIKYSLTRQKSTVLKDWSQMAPFGGNTVGVRSAALRYFGRDFAQLSWAEYALLAVMPNSPTAVNLSVNRDKLTVKRDFLLRKLCDKKYFPKEDLEIYLSEELPASFIALPDDAPYLLDFLSKKYPGKYLFRTTITFDMQREINDMIEKEVSITRQDDIRNGAAVVIDLQNNTLLAYTGNVRYNQDRSRNYVDIIQRPRSYGSLLKPFLYAFALEEGAILPGEMLFDIPTVIGDFQPKNFDETFRGAVTADEVILSSLNVPAVRLLNQVGLPAFYNMLQKLKPTGLDKGTGHYGLSLILGGGETSLWEMARLYKGMALNYLGRSHPYNQVAILQGESNPAYPTFDFSSAAIAHVVNTMADIRRPREERFWFTFDDQNKIAWKTGTSFGHRDAWCIGFNGKYLVGVWMGNENGEGRHDLTGIVRSAPLMFQIFKALPANQWFKTPPVAKANKTISVCLDSGKLAGKHCKKTSKKRVEKESFRWLPCRFHEIVWVNQIGQLSSASCAPGGHADTIFLLPPEVEYYYKASHMFYKGLPVSDPGCASGTANLSLIYPNEGVKIFVPKGENGQSGSILAKAHHSIADSKLYWFLDDKPIPGHQGYDDKVRPISPKPGHHTLTVIDPMGHRSSVRFEVIE